MTLTESLASVRGAGIRVIAHVKADVSDEELRTFAAEAELLGYVAVDAHKAVVDDQRRQLWHRHVALIHRGEATRTSIRWVRELAHASPRAHAVVVIAAEADRVHEGVPELENSLEALRPSERNDLEMRAQRLWTRRRPASARLWATAAVEKARRQGDEAGTALAFAQLLEYADAQHEGAASSVINRGRRLLWGLETLAPRSHVAAGLADLWMTAGEFEAAEAALAAVCVECELCQVAVPQWVREKQCELAGWQGCWELSEVWARECGHFGWRALAALARRDWTAVQVIADAVSPRNPDCDGWRELIAAMSLATKGHARGVVDALGTVTTLKGPARWRDALAVECLRLAGADDEANKWIRGAGARPRGATERLLWEWVTRPGGTGSTTDLEARIRRIGAEGIRRWGGRRQDMHMWAGVSSLLTEVHEAADPATAMRRACRWAREYTGVDAVRIVAADGTVVTCEPDALRQTRETPSQTEALRYGGVRIGDVVVHGSPRDQSEARAVAMALATACAPALRAQLDELQVSRAGDAIAGELLGVSPAIRALRDGIARAAGSAFPVLIEGESGTGKELVARALHRLSARRDRRWAAVNCAALTDELLEAELFGHVRGAFTGAVGPRVGLLEDAHEGTLFLDEVAELSPRAQAKLLRVLQEGEIRRVGENTSRRVDVRLVTATNRSLTESARLGAYREDLIFRLAVIRLRVPPLRDRIEDVPILAHAFWRTIAGRTPTRAVLAPDAIAALCRAKWPGNVRELQNVIAALAVGGPSGGHIRARHVEALFADRSPSETSSPPISLAGARLASDRRAVVASLARHANQRAAAARELGVSRQGLAKLIARLNLEKTPVNNQ